MAKLLVQTTLPNFPEPERQEYENDLSRPEDRNLPHLTSGNNDDLSSDKRSFHDGLALIKDQGNDFLEIVVELFQCLALAVSARKARNIANIQTSVRTVFNNRDIRSHWQGAGS